MAPDQNPGFGGCGIGPILREESGRAWKIGCMCGWTTGIGYTSNADITHEKAVKMLVRMLADHIEEARCSQCRQVGSIRVDITEWEDGKLVARPKCTACGFGDDYVHPGDR